MAQLCRISGSPSSVLVDVGSHKLLTVILILKCDMGHVDRVAGSSSLRDERSSVGVFLSDDSESDLKNSLKGLLKNLSHFCLKFSISLLILLQTESHQVGHSLAVL